MAEYCSIVLLTYRRGKREFLSESCLRNLIEVTDYPHELILVDNTFNNWGLSVGRNHGARMATGKYLCFIDDDIWVIPGWLEGCINLVNFGDKYIATPIHQRLIKKWELPNVKGYRHNARTGSNCMVMRREVFNDIGDFADFQFRGIPYDAAKTGKEYANRVTEKGYSFLLPRHPLALDLGVNQHSYQEVKIDFD